MAIDFDRLTASQYVADLPGRPLDEIRAMRAECQSAEYALSLVRRIIQGRLDIVGGEMARRSEGRHPSTLTELIESLPDLLADRQPPEGNPRPPQETDPTELVDQLLDELDPIVGVSQLWSLTDLDGDELVERVETLEIYERTVSNRRQAMHTTIDALQAEITRRYRTGEASVDSLLS